MPPIPAAFPVQLDGPVPHCAKPQHLALVDAAFERPGGPAAREMKATVCPRCPIGTACLAWAMTQREEGIWGGQGPKGRTQHGAPGARHRGKASDYTPRAYQPPAAAGIPVGVIRTWALAHGLNVHPRGRISRAIREQYVAALAD